MQTKLFGEIDEHVFVPFMKATSDKAEMCKTDSSFVQMYELSFSQSISFRMMKIKISDFHFLDSRQLHWNRLWSLTW